MLPFVVRDKLGRNLHLSKNHPICIVKNLLKSQFRSLIHYDHLSCSVGEDDNYDKLMFGEYHLSRGEAYKSGNSILRTNLSAHLSKFLNSGITSFFITGDVFRRDIIDRIHYPVFHQSFIGRLGMEPEWHISSILASSIMQRLFPLHETIQKKRDLPYADINDYYVKWNDDWVKVLWHGNIKEDIINSCGLDGESGWLICVGLDRMAMILFDIPDIKFFWTKDVRFTSQFKEDEISTFKPFSVQTSYGRDIFIPSGKFIYTDFCDQARDTSGDIIESIDLISVGHYNKYRINYRAGSESEIDEITDRICKLCYGAEKCS